MTDQKREGRMTLQELLAGGMKPGADLGPADRDNEGSFRRGYQHCAVDIARYIQENGPISAELLDAWINGAVTQWRKDVALDRQIMAPALLPEGK